MIFNGIRNSDDSARVDLVVDFYSPQCYLGAHFLFPLQSDLKPGLQF